MADRKTYVMTDAQLEVLLDASKPVRYMVVAGISPRSPQQNANDAWQRLADEMGFILYTVKPVPGKPQTHFTAVSREG